MKSLLIVFKFSVSILFSSLKYSLEDLCTSLELPPDRSRFVKKAKEAHFPF